MVRHSGAFCKAAARSWTSQSHFAPLKQASKLLHPPIGMLKSDVEDEEEAELLLSKAAASSRFLTSLTHEDIGFMARHFSIFSFDQGEVIIQRGETATWMGVVLAGSLIARVQGKQVGQMGIGTIVGEIAFFAGGTRMADVHASEKGFIASVMISEFGKFFVDAPSTAYKLVRLLGSSSVFQITRNQSLHAPLQMALSRGDAADDVQAWIDDQFVPTLEDHDITDEDAHFLVSCMHFHRFDAGEVLLDSFAVNECVCFVVSGSVDVVETWTGKRHPVGTQDKVLYDVEFFGTGVLPCNVVGREPGVVGGLPHSMLQSLALTKPLLSLKVVRMIGASAVEACFEVARDTAVGASGGDEARVIRLSEGSILQSSDKSAAIAEATARRDSMADRSSVDHLGTATPKRRNSAAPQSPMRRSSSSKFEVFYRNTIARQEAARGPVKPRRVNLTAKRPSVERAEEEEKKDEVKQEVKRVVKQSRIVEKKMQAEIRSLEGQLAEAKLENMALDTKVRDLNQESVAVKGELKAVMSAGKKRGASADKAGSKFKMQTQMLLAKAAERHSKEMEEEEDLERTDSEVFRRRMAELDSLKKANKQLRELNETLHEKVLIGEADKERLATELHECKGELDKTTKAARATQASLEEEFNNERETLEFTVESLTKAEIIRTDEWRQVLAELRLARASHETSLSALGEELRRVEALVSQQELTIERQRLAAKGLGIVYVSRLYPLKRENKRLVEKVEGDKQQLLTLPWKLRSTQMKVKKLEESLEAANEALPAARANALAAHVALEEVQAELATTRASLSTATTRTEELEQWGSHLTAELAKAGLQARQLEKSLEKSRKHEDQRAAEVSRWTSRAEFAANEAAKMAVRAVTLEHSFGPLLPPASAPMGKTPRALRSGRASIPPALWEYDVARRGLSTSASNSKPSSIPVLRESVSTPAMGSRPASRGWTLTPNERLGVGSRDLVRLGQAGAPSPFLVPAPQRARAQEAGADLVVSSRPGTSNATRHGSQREIPALAPPLGRGATI